MENTEFNNAKLNYDRDGYVAFQNVLDQDLMQEAKAHIEWLIMKNPNVRPEMLGHTLVKNDPFWVRLLSDDRLLNIAEQFIGPDIALFAAHYISKPAFDGKPVLWHQDGSYWPLDPMKVVTLWLAVDDSLQENGCLRVIPGTQTMELQEMRVNTLVDNVLDSEVDPALVDESKAVDIILKSGGVSVHHPNVIHGSEANLSPLRRCGLTIRYIPTSTTITKPNWPCAFLLRGEAIPGINDYLPKPKYVEGEHMRFKGCELWS
ncbi:phytanoyl-CoA dioxygenase family protein [Paenibacillus psychroresistens]|uniref:Phytanoyl-CoA dioxygenase family protein n=1 Tax=Paenibacillus psychroresistens TaxID=1778678 RepID=A0A6B8RF30_9BACL|nr:phytanoyl-CoA dioxygenase family protein [Paenibacillus psychroresistens]QGQ94537.1 phytanoyl-CoA dioxygenase family protein [Paenibacillus psychroresistens]